MSRKAQGVKFKFDAPAVAQAAGDHLSKPTHPQRAYRDCNVVAQDTVYRQRVSQERTAAAKWEDRWSFITKVDQHGRPRTAPAVPTKWAFFDDKPPPAPPTRQKEIGLALKNPSANVLTMRNIELVDRRARKKTDIGSSYAQSA